LNENLALALLITVDVGVTFMERAGKELAEVLLPYEVDVIRDDVATMASRWRGGHAIASLDRYVVEHKRPTIHLAMPSANRFAPLRLMPSSDWLFDARGIDDVRGKRVAIVDDVSLPVLDRRTCASYEVLGANVVAIGTLVTEAGAGARALGDDARMVRAARFYSGFRPDGSGGLVEDWNG